MTNFEIWIHAFDISVDFELPTFEATNPIYQRYAPGIVSIEKTASYAGLTRYSICLDRQTTMIKVMGQIRDLSDWYAQSCDNADFDNSFHNN